MSDVPGPWTVDSAVLEALRLDTARSALDRDDPHLALVEAEELLDTNPFHFEALLVAAQAASLVGDAWMARQAYEQAFDQRPDHADALRGLMGCRFECLDFEGAIEAAEGLRAHEPLAAEAAYFKALCLERMGKARPAKAAFAEATKLDASTFPADVALDEAAWDEALTSAKSLLPGPIRAFYRSVDIEWGDFPDIEQLAMSEPNISPFIDALYMGMPPIEGDPWTTPPEAVYLFRGNLRRPPAAETELAQRIAAALIREAADWLAIPEPELMGL